MCLFCKLNTKKGILSRGIPESSIENEGLAEKISRESIVSKHGKEKLTEGKYRKRARSRVMEWKESRK